MEFMKSGLFIALALVLSSWATPAVAVDQEGQDAKTTAELNAYLKQYPAADANKDGVLSVSERDTHRLNTVLNNLPPGATNIHVMIPMRDGIKLATEIFLPPGAGPWPVVLIRSAYERWRAGMGDVPSLKKEFVALVTQDLRGDGDSQGKGTFDPCSFDNEINDSYDTIEWIAAQKWCNGRVGMEGTSGHGFAAFMAMLANPPHLVAVEIVNSGGNAYLYWTFQNGMRRSMYDWLWNRGIVADWHWPKPTIQLFNPAKYNALVRKSVASNQCVFIARSGWYDIFAESPVDYMAAYGPSGKTFVTMAASGHGAMQGRPFPVRSTPPGIVMPRFLDVLKGACSNMPSQSILLYYVMGDTVSSNAPGNIWKAAHVWPVPNTPAPFYLLKTGEVSRQAPNDANASLTYAYTPTNPIPTLGGAMYGSPGPMDQSKLKDRTDILRFMTGPLSEPLEITGKVRANLFISTDVPDTMFEVKILDIYPDGYEAIVREGAMMTRFWQGLNQPARLEKDKIYKLDMDLWSTAYVFNAGHRIAIHVASSDSPKYEIHPNSYEPVNAFTNSPTAHNTVHLSKDHASCVILPVITADKPKAP